MYMRIQVLCVYKVAVVARLHCAVAYRGVVQLFNAVRQQQKTLESQLKDAGSSEVKRDKVMKSLDKRAFLDILMGRSCSEPVDSPVKMEAETKVRRAGTKTCSLKVGV
jgi:hypothetical protein